MTGRRAAALAKSGPGEGGNLLPALHNLSGGIGGNGLRPWMMEYTLFALRLTPRARARQPQQIHGSNRSRESRVASPARQLHAPTIEERVGAHEKGVRSFAYHHSEPA